jgi:hypothetical protein
MHEVVQPPDHPTTANATTTAAATTTTTHSHAAATDPRPQTPSSLPSAVTAGVGSALWSDVSLVRRWLIGLTLKDVSLMITLAPTSSLEDQGAESGSTAAADAAEATLMAITVPYAPIKQSSTEGTSTSTTSSTSNTMQFTAHVSVVDLDLKPASKLQGYWATEQKLLALQQRNPRPDCQQTPA